MAEGNVLCVVGGQYGSEGKGVIVHHLADKYDVHVRVGSPNAGHSFYHEGQKHVMQQIPCGWTNKNATLILGRGALVNPDILVKEIKYIQQFDSDILNRLIVDPKAGVLDDKFAQEEGHTHGEIHQRIGSTGEGVGAARVARINRDPAVFRLFEDAMEEVEEQVGHLMKVDSVAYINKAVQSGVNVLIEGTQGFALSLIHGPWPYVTSTDTNAAQMIADVGISPRLLNEIVLVCRTFPIRVAGNSGPLKHEISWVELSEMLGKEVTERTTVTKKVRRVGMWDGELVARAVAVNRPTSLAITFMDYWEPDDEGKTQFSQLSDKSRSFIKGVETQYGIPVSLIGTGGEGWKIIQRTPKV